MKSSARRIAGSQRRRKRSVVDPANGGPGGNRTPDQRLRSPLLYPLSYGPAKEWRARGDLNPRPLAPQANALSTELRARATLDCARRL